LDDEDSPNFGVNKNSAILYNDVTTDTDFPKPLVLFNLIPKYPKEEKIKMSVSELNNWLDRNSKGYYPVKWMEVFYFGYEKEPKIDGVVYKHSQSKDVLSYFEVLNSGFIERGVSYSIAKSYKDNNGKYKVLMFLTKIIAYEMVLLGFAKKFYELAKYYDEVLLQISFINVLNIRLYGLNEAYGNSRHRWDDISNKQHNNFMLRFKFNPQTLTDENILEIAKEHSEKICRVFGFGKDYCFVDDKLSEYEAQGI